MAISFISAGSLAEASSGNITITPPATVDRDIIICGVTSHDNVVSTFPAGWNVLTSNDNTTAMHITVAWKRATGVEGAFTVTHTAGDGIVGNTAVYRGCSIKSDLIHLSSVFAATSDSTVTVPSITTTISGCMMIFLMHDSDNGASSSENAVNLGNLNERFDSASTLGLDQAVSLSDILFSGAGATGNFTGSLSLGPDANVGVAIALKEYLPITWNNYLFANAIGSSSSVTEKIR